MGYFKRHSAYEMKGCLDQGRLESTASLIEEAGFTKVEPVLFNGILTDLDPRLVEEVNNIVASVTPTIIERYFTKRRQREIASIDQAYDYTDIVTSQVLDKKGGLYDPQKRTGVQAIAPICGSLVIDADGDMHHIDPGDVLFVPGFSRVLAYCPAIHSDENPYVKSFIVTKSTSPE